MKSNLITKIDYKFSHYYLNCDFINKYNLNSINKKPFLKHIVLEISLNEVINSFLSKIQYKNENIQIISYVLFYNIFTLLPFINFNKMNLLQLINKNNYCLKIIFNNEQEIYSFLHDISEKLSIEYLKKNETKINFSTNFILTEFCKAENFFELESFLNNYIKNISIKKLNFYLHFNFINSIKLNSKKKFLENFPFLHK